METSTAWLRLNSYHSGFYAQVPRVLTMLEVFLMYFVNEDDADFKKYSEFIFNRTIFRG